MTPTELEFWNKGFEEAIKLVKETMTMIEVIHKTGVTSALKQKQGEITHD